MPAKKVAVTVALLLAAVAVAALVVLVANNNKTTSHQAFCQQYKDDITLDYTDDQTAPISTTGLSGSIAAGVAKDERTYQRAYAKASSGSCGYISGGECLTPDDIQSSFDSYVHKEIPQLLAERGC